MLARERATASAARSGPDSRVASSWPFLTVSPRCTLSDSMTPSTGERTSTV